MHLNDIGKVPRCIRFTRDIKDRLQIRNNRDLPFRHLIIFYAWVKSVARSLCQCVSLEKRNMVVSRYCLYFRGCQMSSVIVFYCRRKPKHKEDFKLRESVYASLSFPLAQSHASAFSVYPRNTYPFHSCLLTPLSLTL